MFEILRELTLRKRTTYFKIYDVLMNPKQGRKILHRVTVLVESSIIAAFAIKNKHRLLVNRRWTGKTKFL